MKIKNKGKVHPSPTTTDPVLLSTLQLLPPTILSLASVLPPHDLQVLSYLLARSLRLSTPNYSSSPSSSHASSSPSSDCDCFNCYTFYWLRWDSSPNRDLIHRVIDAFEEHLSPSSSTSSSSPAAGKSKVGRRRGKDRNGGRNNRELPDIGFQPDVSCSGAPGTGDVMVAEELERNNDDDDDAAVTATEVTSPGGAVPPSPTPTVGGEHKGLARKVLPDVLGILNSRLWNLWSPDG
ncbi:hypothetical protein MLD38_040356 [Melastoma candidum]|uniref:Uncharacterized protein n=1 Tax=Melastoma candidum TaxID=119954 RepID=A0ACB9L632_9MYRT|nr:hypothetical protein MLD38_040356 [Melastoma candidum]